MILDKIIYVKLNIYLAIENLIIRVVLTVAVFAGGSDPKFKMSERLSQIWAFFCFCFFKAHSAVVHSDAKFERLNSDQSEEVIFTATTVPIPHPRKCKLSPLHCFWLSIKPRPQLELYFCGAWKIRNFN